MATTHSSNDKEVNENNVNFIKTIFFSEKDGVEVADPVGLSFPQTIYKLRIAGLTEFDPYISEAPRFDEETEENYKARVLTSGRYFGEQEIILDDLVHSDQNIENLEIDSQYLDGKIPRSLVFIDRYTQQEDSSYEVKSVNLNDLGAAIHSHPSVNFPVDNLDQKKGYLIYRKTSTVHKYDAGSNGALVSLTSGWNQVTGFSNTDLVETLGDQTESLENRIKAAGFVDNHTQINDSEGNQVYKGYESLNNELFTEYKVLNSGDFLDEEGNYKKLNKANELTSRRTINLKVDPAQNYSLERKVTRKSNNESNPADWETIQHNVSFPFNDDEDLSDYITTNIVFDTSPVYEVVQPKGDNSSSKDYFEIDFPENWGKSKKDESGGNKVLKNTISNRVKTDHLSFEKGESVKINQKSTLRDVGEGANPVYEQHNSIDMAFSPFSTGRNGFLTGDGNDKNFYELEYQFVPKAGFAKKLYYETGESLSVGQEVFYNTGSKLDDQGNTVYEPIATNFFGQTPDLISDVGASVNISDVSVMGGEDPSQPNRTLDMGPSYLLNSSNDLLPEVVPESSSSGVGYSYFTSGEKYIVCPKGGYNTAFSESRLQYHSAGETFKSFSQGEQQDDLDAEYALTEYRTFDDNPDTDETFYPKKSRDIRIGESAFCLGDSCSDLKDFYLIPNPPYLLHPEYQTDFTLTNGSLLNIDGSDGSIKISNLINNKQQFAKRSNLFFEKNYVASLTVMANGEKQDISALKQFMKDDEVYYLERDIYIDSDTRSQANSSGPIFSSSSQSQSIKPFSVDVSTPNPNSLGEEKLYVTQTYHRENLKKIKYPFNDYDYFNPQPSIVESFRYSNISQNIIDNFKLTNTVGSKTYRPGDFTSLLGSSGSEKIGNFGYSILLYLGKKITPSSASGSEIVFSSLVGYYYELQHTSDSGKTWTTLSHAHRATSTSTSMSATDNTEANYRVLEWASSRILTSYDQAEVPCESSDALILKSATDNKFYDISKCYHSVKRNGGFVTVSDTGWSGTIHALNLENDALKYLSIAEKDLNEPNKITNTAFNILQGEFSIEFWIKKNSGTGTILERPGSFKVYMSDTNTLAVNFNNAEEDQISGIALGDDWQHVAITKTKTSDPEAYNLDIYIEGTKQGESRKFLYESFISESEEPLEIGRSTLVAKLYQPRIYIGRSLYNKNFTATKSEFTEEANVRKYKVLKYQYHRETQTGSDWIINRNTFDNASVPSDYDLPNQDGDEFTTKHNYEWMSVTPEAGSSTMEKRAIAKYFTNYAFRAPNNPHINKNYEGTRIKVDTEINPDNYAFYVGEDEVDDPFVTDAAPYYYEYLGNSNVGDIRLNKKGGEDTKNIKANSEGGNSSFSNASRLRVTKYVYRLYTKDALVVADTGFKGSRSSQEGWTYALQYKVSGGNWQDLEADMSYEDYLLFYQDEVSFSAKPQDNTEHASVLPMLVLKTDITKKYAPEDIEFRVTKKQIISIPSTSTNNEVLKKYNFLPLEVNIPTKNTLLDITKKGQNDTDSAQEAYTEIDTSLHQAVVHLDENQTYVINKSSTEKILTTSDTTSDLELAVASINDTEETLALGSTETTATLENNKPYRVSNLTGVRIYNASSNITQTSDITSVVGVEPDELNLTRFEKHEGNIKRGESGSYGADQTKIFFTPSITGSHFEDLQDFQQYTADNSSEDSLFSFGCESFVTGQEGVTVSTGVSGVSWRPVHDFHSDPYITGAYTINADDDGKTFLVSGSQADLTFKGNEYSVEIANLGSNNVNAYEASKISTVKVADGSASTGGTAGGLETILPLVSNTNEPNSEGDFVIVDGLSKLDVSTINEETTLVNISSGDCYIDSNYTLGSMSGVSYNSNGSRKNNIDSGVLVLDHEKISLTPNDASETIFIDTDSEVFLPSEFSNNQHVTLVNSTNHQLKVVPESEFLIDSAASNYIPKRSARKFTYSSSSWSTEDIEVLSFNQLSVTNSDDKKVFIHNEDVDVRINSGSIEGGFSFTIARSQIEDITFGEEFINQQKTRLIRFFVDDVLQYVSKPGEVAITATKESYGWSFDNIPVISGSGVTINPQSNKKVFIANKGIEKVNMTFENSENYTADFEIFIISLFSVNDFRIHPESKDSSLKFYQEGQIIDEYVSSLSKSTAIRIHRGGSSTGKETGTFIFETIDRSSLQKLVHSGTKDQVIINYNEFTSFEYPVLGSNFNQDNNFKVDIVNSSEGKSFLKYPREAFASDINTAGGEGFASPEIASFSHSSVSFNKNADEANPYQNFVTEAGGALTRANTINDGDVVVFDGSVPSLDVKRFIGVDAPDSEEREVEEIRISALGSDRFRFDNHNLRDKQKITFDLANLTIVDYYLEHPNNGTDQQWSPDDFSGNIKTGTAMQTGQTLAVFDMFGARFFLYEYQNDGTLKETKFTTVYKTLLSESEDYGFLFEIPNKMFLHIKEGGGDGTNNIDVNGKTFDLAGAALSTRANQSAAESIADTLSFTNTTTKDFYVKTINENVFELYEDSDLGSKLSCPNAVDYKFFSDKFQVHGPVAKRAHIINLSNSSIQPKQFTSQENIDSPLSANHYNEYVLDSANAYSTTDLSSSGVYIVDGYDSSDTTNITSLSSSQVLITGDFHAQADLTNFNNHYFVNGGLDSVTIKNTNDSSTDSLVKNKAYKHTSNGTFTAQNLNDSNNRDVIYYPKNEIHVLNRTNLGFDYSTNIGCNFVFYNYEEYDEENKIILPNNRNNLGNVAVVNLSDAPVNVENFDGNQGPVEVKSHQAVFFSDATDLSFNSSSNVVDTSGDEIYESTINSISYSFDVDKDAGIVRVNEEETFVISKVGQIVIDYDVHNGKKILVERDTSFIGPYLYEGGSNPNEYTFSDTNFNFQATNISVSPINVDQEKYYSQYTYEVRLDSLAKQRYREGYKPIIIKSEAVTDQQIDLEFSQPQPNYAKTYHIFGKILELTLQVKYRNITELEATELYEVMQLTEAVNTNDYYTVEGLVEQEIKKLNIINLAFEDIRIAGISCGSGSESFKSALEERILESFNTTTINGETKSLSTYNSDSVKTEISSEEAVEQVFLAKDKVMTVSIPTDLYNTNDYFSVAFDSDFNVINDSDDSYELGLLTNLRFRDVKYIKRRRVPLSSIEQDNQTLFAFPYAADVYIPPAETLHDKLDAGFAESRSFTIVNSSRAVVNLISSDGKNLDSSNSSIAMAAGSAKKIKFTKSTKAFSDVSSSEITVSTVGTTLSDVPSGVFVASSVNSQSAPLLLNKSLGKIKIINNTGFKFYLKNADVSANVAGQAVYEVSAGSYVDLIVKGDNFIVHNLNENISFSNLSSSILISESSYKDKAVLFEAEKGADIEISFDSDSFFSTTIVPFVRTADFVDITEGYRLEKYDIRYAISNKSNDYEIVSGHSPKAIKSTGVDGSKDVEPLIHLKEFLVDSSVNGKILLLNKSYELIFKNSATTTAFIYNTNREDYGFYTRRLDSNDEGFTSAENIVGPNDSGEVLSIHNTIALKAVQSGANNPTITQQETYNNIFIDNELRKKVYLNKSFYNGKIIVCNEGYEIIYNDDSPVDFAFINLSSLDSLVIKNKLTKQNEYDFDSIVEAGRVMQKKHPVQQGEGDNKVWTQIHTVSLPLHTVANNSKTYIITQPADIKYTGTGYPLSIINSSSKNVNITTESEIKKLYFAEKATYTNATTATYRKCPGYNRKEWFLKLFETEMPHLERDLGYFNQAEYDLQNRVRKNVMVDYIRTLYRFSNYFQTNHFLLEDGLSGYERIQDYNSFYKFGVKLYGERKSQVIDIAYDTNPIDYITCGLKLTWDMPRKVIGYSMSTGHERLAHCKEFDQRNNLVTYSGIEPNRTYMLEDFDDTELNFVSSAVRTSDDEDYPSYKYLDTKKKSFVPRVIYNGKSYGPAEKFTGVAGKSDYQLENANFAILKASQFVIEDDFIAEESSQISEQAKELNKELNAKVEDATSGVQSPIWSQVPSGEDHQKEFINATVEGVYSSGSNVELLQGRKLKDIEGVYRGGSFEFKVPVLGGKDNYSSNYSDVQLVNDGDSENFVFKIVFGESSGVDYPGYDYEIKSSLTFQNNTNKDILRLALSEKDSIPFEADGSIKSLNLDFSTDFDDSASIKGGVGEGSFSRRLALRDGNRIVNLKNNTGYSFVPFAQYEGNTYGLSLTAEEGREQHKGIRIRLKKLAKQQITFEDLKDDLKVGQYLKDNAEEATLQYNLDAEVNSIAYHDIARPGGVLKNCSNWTKLTNVSNNEITTTGIEVNDGDAVGLLKSGDLNNVEVYFARVISKTSTNEAETKFELLRIFSKDDSIDSSNIISVAANDYIKVLNYFTLATETDGTHREIKSSIESRYNTKEEFTTLTSPILISNQMFFLEVPRTEIGGERVDGWSGDEQNRVFKGDTIRANFELSTVAKYWFGETSKGKSWQFSSTIPYYKDPKGNDPVYDTHWVNEPIFDSNKNLLFRATTQFERINYTNDIYNYNVKLNKNIKYRYIIKPSDYIQSVGNSLTGGGEFYNTNEDFKIIIKGLDTEEQRKQHIYENICIIESTDYIDPCPHTKEIDGKTIAHSEYMDYQLPEVNHPNYEYETIFLNVDPSYYESEGIDSIFSYDSKAENLTVEAGEGIKPISDGTFKAGLFYDFGMPAICKYIYTEYSNKNTLGFSITGFWDGFFHKFGDQNTLFKVKPTELNYDIESYDGSSWSVLEADVTQSDKIYAVATTKELSKDTRYRLKINYVEIQYKNPNDSQKQHLTTSKINYIRLPFKWTSIIKDSNLGASSSGKYTIDLEENHLIGKSVSIPKEGVSKFGEFNYLKDGVPYTRLYMFNFEYKLRASYKDPISRNGISKVIITDKGDHYRTTPTVTIASPEEADGTQATGRAIIENGKLKFIDVVNSGSGYLDPERDTAKRIEQSKQSNLPFIAQKTKVVARNNSNIDKSLDYNGKVAEAFNQQNGLKTVSVTLTPNESSLPPEVQEEFGLTFGETESIAESTQAQIISKSNSRATVDLMKGSSEDDETWSAIQDQANRIQGISNFVNKTINDLKESQSYDSIDYQESQEIKGTENENIDGLYEEHYTDNSDNNPVSNSITFDNDGNITSVVQFETFPAVENGAAVAVVNNSSIAEYRVINNKIASKTTPWISSFSREQNPNLPQSFGLLPTAGITGEVFNSYARAVNFLSKIRIDAPIYAKVRRFRQIEWRYISSPSVAGLTFAPEADSVESGQQETTFGDGEITLSSMTYDKQSKVNFIEYLDPNDQKFKKAYFSSFTSDGFGESKKGELVTVYNQNKKEYGGKKNIVESDGEDQYKLDIWDQDTESLTAHGEELFEVRTTEEGHHDEPRDVGFPNRVNIPTELGVHCNPANYYIEGGTAKVRPDKSKGLTLPELTNKRAYAYGGEVIEYATSEIHDVSSDSAPFNVDSRHKGTTALYFTQGELTSEDFEPITDDIVDIKSGDYIKAGYQNEIVFGCQTNGKPFNSAFLRTIKVWTEYEVISDPQFVQTLPEEVRHKYKPEESKLRCILSTKKVNCENGKIGEVEAGKYHNICNDGKKGSQIINSYESEFDYTVGDDVIGPKQLINESSQGVISSAKAKFDIEPEFNLALAVYISNKDIPAISSVGGTNSRLGPCMHHCMPGEVKTLSLSEDPLIFDLKK